MSEAPKDDDYELVTIEEFRRRFHEAAKTADKHIALQTAFVHVAMVPFVMMDPSRHYLAFAIEDWFRDRNESPELQGVKAGCTACHKENINPDPLNGPAEEMVGAFVCVTPCGDGHPKHELTLACPVCRECVALGPQEVIARVGNQFGAGHHEKFDNIEAAKAAGKEFAPPKIEV